jgi:membrane associated rhomboid family serine protease
MFNVRQRLDTQWQLAKKHLMLVLLWAGVLWAVFIIDSTLPDTVVDLRKWGIHSRTVSGLASIAVAPFIHVNLWHLMANTLPFVILGWITVMSGRALFLKVCLVSALVSGVIFGLLGFLLTRGWFARRLLYSLTSLGVGLFYFGTVLSLLRADDGISWSSHFWGFAGGTGLAWWMYGRAPAAPVPAVPEKAKSP